MELKCFCIVSGPKEPNCATSLSLLLLAGTATVAVDSAVVDLVARFYTCVFISVTFILCGHRPTLVQWKSSSQSALFQAWSPAATCGTCSDTLPEAQGWIWACR